MAEATGVDGLDRTTRTGALSFQPIAMIEMHL